MSAPKRNLPLPAGFKLEEYCIERMISHGGFSIVYLGKDAAGMDVAIKEYLPNFISLRGGVDPQPTVQDTHRSAFNHGLRSFFEESRALASLNHPNVVRVLNFFRANGTAYLVMQFEHGRTLHQHMSKHKGALREHFVRSLFGRLLNGLREVHSHKLLHLDIKPANIYLRYDGSPVLLDFGAARQVIGEDSPSLRSVHTPGFSAPEQHDKDIPLGPWTDIYAVGASLYACLGGKSPVSVRERMENDTLVSAVHAFSGRYSRQLLETVDQCLRLDHLKRPQSVLALQKLLAMEGGAVDSPSLMKRFLALLKKR